MPIHRPLVLSILKIYGHHEHSRTRHCSLSFRQHRPHPCVLILEQSQKKNEEQIHKELEKPRVAGPFGRFLVATLRATEFAGINIPATVDPWLEHADKTPPDIGVEAISYRVGDP